MQNLRGGSEAAQRKMETGSELQFTRTQGSAGEAVLAQGLGGRETQPPGFLRPCPLLPRSPSYAAPHRSSPHALPVRPFAPTSLPPFPWCRRREFTAPGSVRATKLTSARSANSLSWLSGKRHSVLNAIPARTCTSHEMFLPSGPGRKKARTSNRVPRPLTATAQAPA